MKLLALILVFTCAALAGTKPRAAASDYKTFESHDGISVGAEIVPEDQLKNLFSTDLRHGYIVIEVAIYPAKGQPLNLDIMDFLLRGGADQTIRAASPRAIPRAIQDKDAPRPSDITVYPTVGVAYENGPYGHRVYTNAGVAIASGQPSGQTSPPPPASSPQDRHTMQLELEEKGMPEGTAIAPVAGYLYFPYTANKRKKVSFELEYHSPSAPIRLQLK